MMMNKKFLLTAVAQTAMIFGGIAVAVGIIFAAIYFLPAWALITLLGLLFFGWIVQINYEHLVRMERINKQYGLDK